ncbi:hypothetical protein SISSUDRAFT_171000 [Sistotremastrum suecicum HHB10207 ss-3]|uniref:Uncharacterized protein n=1 Tax=Sistotremastrum suecicum HHB10207 ss-3 TaxID=1314776 RepID=A0A166AKM9_9AGAM|nr:hypothetical protein SISSUDRAFT_171000 [Sistotremastrum suecicum HHB10207 ss-3]
MVPRSVIDIGDRINKKESHIQDSISFPPFIDSGPMSSSTLSFTTPSPSSTLVVAPPAPAPTPFRLSGGSLVFVIGLVVSTTVLLIGAGVLVIFLRRRPSVRRDPDNRTSAIESQLATVDQSFEAGTNPSRSRRGGTCSEYPTLPTYDTDRLPDYVYDEEGKKEGGEDDATESEHVNPVGAQPTASPLEDTSLDHPLPPLPPSPAHLSNDATAPVPFTSQPTGAVVNRAIGATLPGL